MLFRHHNAQEEKDSQEQRNYMHTRQQHIQQDRETYILQHRTHSTRTLVTVKENGSRANIFSIFFHFFQKSVSRESYVGSGPPYQRH